MDPMVRTVHLHVTTNVMVVTTSMVSVIEGVNRAGEESTVKNVIIFKLYCFVIFLL